MPENWVRFILRRSWIIRPGLETSSPRDAVNRYRTVLEKKGRSLQGKRVLVFGYGGRFAVGTALLRQGAAHVILCDKYAPPDEPRNRALLPQYDEYLVPDDDHVLPRPEWITLVEDDIRETAKSGALSPADVVVSSSVYEHLDDVDGITRALAALTKPDGVQLHFVDLRDHFFKYPFEMLCYSEHTWKTWLNPSSNHNRFRMWDYQRVFENYFGQVEIKVLERDETAFQKTLPRIRPEFVSGNSQDDCVTLIQVIASHPRS